ncbi:MAG TPA: type VI secretion system tip protein TssI/VgrG [Candidatus Saccharimonadales bacterium]|jgi:type VI secretion system secreted protein VgrG|nr:type VI secretion system tip protein TssI/VgrG [Candidatus Saccharimonadales bacterium]
MSSPTFVQGTRHFVVTTPLGADKFLLTNFQGEEQISGLFHYRLELISQDDAVDFSQIVGKNITVTIELPGGSDKQYVNGVVGKFTQGGKSARFTTYIADVYPWLWLLTLNSDHRIFQNKSVPDILQQVFSDLGFTDFKNSLTKTYQPREFCVQYGETSFNFVSRLMESEGIFYFFDHTSSVHTMVLADDASAWLTMPGLDTVQASSSGRGWETADAMLESHIEEQVMVGQFKYDDYNFVTPSTDLLATASGTDTSRSFYEYPGNYASAGDGATLTGLRLDALQAPGKLLKGSSMCRAFHAGGKFTLAKHYRADANTAWVLGSVTHQGSEDGYSNSFSAFPASVKFHPLPLTPAPKVAGSQTALVVGKPGEEIWTDEYGRIKVKFYWDQSSPHDETSSCWIRVAQGWAGLSWGSIFVPRIGQEVVVSFLEGNPDRPLVTGCVYNATQTVPYPLPDEQTKSTIKTNSSKGGGGFNELRFEDKKDSEELFMQAQKDMNVIVLNDLTTTVTNNRTTTVQKKDDSLVVDKGNRSIKVNTGNETHEVKGKRDLTITGNETHTDKANFTHTVTGNYTLKVSGNLSIEVDGSVSIKSGTTFDNKAGTALTNNAGTALTNKAGTTMSNEAQVSITSKANASHDVESSGILTLKGSLVKIN